MSSSGPPVPFSSLPLSKSNPDTKLNAWGLYGETDELGFLNRQTDEIVAAAASEIKTGVRVSLNAALDFQGMSCRSSRSSDHILSLHFIVSPVFPTPHQLPKTRLTHTLTTQATAPSSAAKSSKKMSTKNNPE